MGELPRDDGYQEDLTVAFDGAAGHAIEIEAGSLGTWTFTYRCGDQPVPDGGSISFWNDQTNVPCAYVPQTDDPAGWDYVTVETDGDAELELVHLARTYKDNRFCEVRVVRGELRHGDSVVLRGWRWPADGGAPVQHRTDQLLRGGGSRGRWHLVIPALLRDGVRSCRVRRRSWGLRRHRWWAWTSRSRCTCGRRT